MQRPAVRLTGRPMHSVQPAILFPCRPGGKSEALVPGRWPLTPWHGTRHVAQRGRSPHDRWRAVRCGRAACTTEIALGLSREGVRPTGCFVCCRRARCRRESALDKATRLDSYPARRTRNEVTEQAATCPQSPTNVPKPRPGIIRPLVCLVPDRRKVILEGHWSTSEAGKETAP